VGHHVKKLIVALVEDEAGLTMVEYAAAGASATSAAVAAFYQSGRGGCREDRIPPNGLTT